MPSPADIKTILERNAKALALRPSVGQGTAVTKVRMRDGLACDIEEGKWRFSADMSTKSGGDDSAPNPGVYGRAALGSCVAIGYLMWAARRELPIISLEVEVQADYDVRGELGVADIPPSYTQVRYVVTVETSAPEADVRRVLDEADARSSWADIFRRGQDTRRELRIVAPVG